VRFHSGAFMCWAKVLPPLMLATACGGGGTEPPPTTGTVRVVAHTDGRGLDLDGYTARLDQASPLSLSINGTVTFLEVEPGAHAVNLSGVADNCDVTQADVAITVVAGDTSVVDVPVECHIDLHGRLVIVSEAYGLPELLAMYPDGSQRYRVLADQFSNAGPAILPDGSGMIYGSNRNGEWHLFRFEAATGAVTPLPHIDVMEFSPAVSPDGSLIAFEVMTIDASSNEAFRIWVMGANGENPTALTTGGPSEPPDVAPSWSSDGWIVFSRNGALHRMLPDGTMLTPIPCSPGPCNHPAWSPDGSRLAYTGLSDDTGDGIGENHDIYVMDLVSGDAQRLTTSPDQEDTPKWSPDGAALAYHRVIEGRIQVFRMQADGSDPVNLTNQPVSEAQPAWGPVP
jgi:Tol biopolymer transport system component